jgi:hypothetical protein
MVGWVDGPFVGHFVQLKDFPELGQGRILRERRDPATIGGWLKEVEVLWDDGEITCEDWPHIEVIDND